MNPSSFFAPRALALYAACSIFAMPLYRPAEAAALRRVCFNDTCVSVEIADTAQSRQRGLMFRTELAEGRGMLFVFERAGLHAFWMKNTTIPLDILWLDRDLRVVDIKTYVPPCETEGCPSFAPGKDALFVLEVNAGFVDTHRISVGDVARLCDE